MPASTGLRCVAPPALLIEIDNQTLEPTNNKGGGESQLVQAKQTQKGDTYCRPSIIPAHPNSSKVGLDCR